MTIYEDEIDIRPYILAIIKYWWIIVLLALAAGLAALIFSLLQVREFQATTTVLLTRSRATLELAEQFPTINEPVDARARMDSLVSITSSDVIASQTLNALDGRLASEFEDYSNFKESVEVSSEGDLLLITAAARDPELAVEIANEWARQTVTAINVAYSGEQPLAVIQDQLESANKEYNTAQSELEAFIQDNQINFLNSQINEAQTLYSSLAEYRTQKITYFYTRKLAMEDLIVQAEGLKEQLGTGSRSEAGNVGDALAVLKARSTALGIIDYVPEISIDSGLPIKSSFQDGSSFTIDLQLADVNAIIDSPAAYAADLDDIIDLAEAELVKAESAWKSLAEDVSQGEGYGEIKRFSEQISSLESRLEIETARQTELTTQRDLAWKAYQAIAQKEAELRNAPQEANLVTIAGLAVQPQQPVSRGTAQNVIIATLLGGFVGVALVLGMTWWRNFNQPAGVESPIDVEETAELKS